MSELHSGISQETQDEPETRVPARAATKRPEPLPLLRVRSSASTGCTSCVELREEVEALQAQISALLKAGAATPSVPESPHAAASASLAAHHKSSSYLPSGKELAAISPDELAAMGQIFKLFDADGDGAIDAR
jgi:hypothetical protein